MEQSDPHWNRQRDLTRKTGQGETHPMEGRRAELWPKVASLVLTYPGFWNPHLWLNCLTPGELFNIHRIQVQAQAENTHKVN